MKSATDIFDYEASYAYTLAWTDELTIEAELCGGRSKPQRADVLKRCLRQIDEWKAAGEYEPRVGDLRGTTPHVTSFPEIGNALARLSSLNLTDEHATNFLRGLRSPDEEQRRAFEDFAEATGLMTMTPRESMHLIKPLARAKKKGHRRKLSPPWRNIAPALDQMRVLVNAGRTPHEAALEVAGSEAVAQKESRATRYRKEYMNRLAIRN